MDGLIKEAGEIMESTEVVVVCDAGIMAASQKVGDYEITTYGTLKSFVRVAGENKAATLLEQTLKEEKSADVKLSDISDTLNMDAVE